MDLFVGNFSFDATEPQLRQLFEQYGTVASAKIITDRETQRSRGFGFVRMEDPREAERAIQELNEFNWDVGGRSRPLSVREAEARSQGGGGRPQQRRFDNGGRSGNRW